MGSCLVIMESEIPAQYSKSTFNMLLKKSLLCATIFIIQMTVICQGLFIPRAIDKIIKDVPKISFGNWRPISRPRPTKPFRGDNSQTTSNHGQFFPSPEPYIPPTHSKPIRFEDNNENSIKYLLNPKNPSDASGTSGTSHNPFTTPSYPIFVTSEGKTNEFDSTNQSIQNILQDSKDTISQISENNLFYEETNKLKGKPKLVDGNVENYRPRP